MLFICHIAELTELKGYNTDVSPFGLLQFIYKIKTCGEDMWAKEKNRYDNVPYALYTYPYYWLVNTLITNKNCCSHAVSHLVLGETSSFAPFLKLYSERFTISWNFRLGQNSGVILSHYILGGRGIGGGVRENNADRFLLRMLTIQPRL